MCAFLTSHLLSNTNQHSIQWRRVTSWQRATLDSVADKYRHSTPWRLATSSGGFRSKGRRKSPLGLLNERQQLAIEVRPRDRGPRGRPSCNIDVLQLQATFHNSDSSTLDNTLGRVVLQHLECSYHTYCNHLSVSSRSISLDLSP